MEYKRLKDLDTEIHKLMSQVFEMEDGEEKELKKIKITELMDERDHERKLAITGFMPRVMRGLNTTKSRSYYNHIKTRDELADDTPIFEHSSIEDFEDYFQELFDKYNIISKNRQIPPRGVMAYDEEDTQMYYSTMDSKLLGRNICLTNVNKEMGDKIVNDIEKMLPNLEKRIGNTLRIDYKKTTYGINSYYIRIEYIKEA